MREKTCFGEKFSNVTLLEILRKTVQIFHIFPAIKDKSCYKAMRKERQDLTG